MSSFLLCKRTGPNMLNMHRFFGSHGKYVLVRIVRTFWLRKNMGTILLKGAHYVRTILGGTMCAHFLKNVRTLCAHKWVDF